ncbi:hypothetical protein Tco_1454086 [Tanacetum coccineum]
MVGVETSMSELKERVDVSHQHLEELGSYFAELREDFKSAFIILFGNLGREIHDLRGMLMGEIMRIRGEVKEEGRSLRRELKDLRADVSLYKRFMASGGGNTSNIAPKVEVPKPSPFMGKRKAMEQYLEGVNVVDDASKIKMVSRYLKDTTALWWRRRPLCSNEFEEAICVSRRMLSMKKRVDFTNLSIPERFESMSRNLLLLYLRFRIFQTKTLSSIFLMVKDGEDGVTAIAHAQALIDLVEWRSRKPTNEDSGDEQVGGKKQVKDLDDRAQRPPRKEITSYKSIKCFVCDGPPKARDCPEK